VRGTDGTHREPFFESPLRHRKRTSRTTRPSGVGLERTKLVDLKGFEPLTSSMPWKRAPNCATGPHATALNHTIDTSARQRGTPWWRGDRRYNRIAASEKAMTKEKYAWAGLGIPLAWLAELDNVTAPNALADAFGDSYLYRHNRVFAALRDAALDFGYRFSAEDTPLWRDYQSLSLLVLHRILSDKTIPYFDTASSFRRLIVAHPAARLSPGFLAGNLKRNYAFHESAHCVAHSIMSRMETEWRAVCRDEAGRAVLEAILAESFANAVEALGSICRHLPISDRVFYSLNSYFLHSEKLQNLLDKAGADLGPELRFIVLFFSYFEANLALGPPADSTYPRIVEAGGCSADQAGLAREIADAGFKLNAGFRETTTPAYFELLGYTGEYQALAGAQWLCVPQNRSFALALAQLFWAATGKA
jgi:hypothetical protein